MGTHPKPAAPPILEKAAEDIRSRKKSEVSEAGDEVMSSTSPMTPPFTTVGLMAMRGLGVRSKPSSSNTCATRKEQVHGL